MNNAVFLRQLFPFGKVVTTTGAMNLLSRTQTDPFAILQRHIGGDWGVVDEEDKKANDLAVNNGTRILSAYALGAAQDKIWLITEADRNATTFLLPGEY